MIFLDTILLCPGSAIAPVFLARDAPMPMRAVNEHDISFARNSARGGLFRFFVSPESSVRGIETDVH